MRPARRIVAVADSDSYVKWAAALLGTLDGRWDASLLVLRTPLAVSDDQLDSQLRGGGLPRERVSRVAWPDLMSRLGEQRADAVVLAGRGPLVRMLAREIAGLSPRPVIVTGLPGISIPATRKAIVYRTQCDLFLLHSHRERREFDRLSVTLGMPQRFALATLPFARSGGALPGGGGTDLVFAPQAKVPAARADRLRIARLLVRAADADPSRRVVVKLRAARGEMQTHAERDSYPDLLATLGRLPANLVTSTTSMASALRTAEGVLTVSSTAAIEAIALGLPVIALDSFGVAPALINEVLADAGLLGSEDDVVERSFRRPAEAWLEDNYFHRPEDDDWAQRMGDLIDARRSGVLAPQPPLGRIGGALRDAWERKTVLGPQDRSFAGALALALGVPLRSAIRLVHRARRHVASKAPDARMRAQQPGPDGFSRQVSSTSAVRTSTTRTS
ncbi:DUF6716 putative glycosyltransferase [Microbacterium sp. NPDC056003]|uniref:DUF6716 putative glycosyltransferase n=1 Tax=Microbacterium sp. NPDC056003 TaxID=3345676 RepID=UPI0035D5AB43